MLRGRLVARGQRPMNSPRMPGRRSTTFLIQSTATPCGQFLRTCWKGIDSSASYKRSMIMRTCSKLLFTVVIAAVLAFASAGAARADQIIFSNFGPGMTFDTNHGYTGAGSSALGTSVMANRFTATSNLSFSSAQLALGLSSGSPSILQVLLETDAGGVPGSI